MTYEEVKRLLTKFYDGQSTVDEEEQLRQYFTTTDVPADVPLELKADFEADRRVVLALSEADAAEPSAELERRVSDVLATPPAVVLRPTKQVKQVKRLYRLRLVAASIAAVAVVAVGIYVWNRPTPVSTVYSDTCASADEAAAQTEEILIYVSNTMNEALSAEDELGGPQP